MKLADYVKLFDMFALPVRLTFKRQPQHRTIFGSFITIILIAFLVTEVYFFGQDIIERQKPTTLLSQHHIMNSESFEINDKTYPILLSFESASLGYSFLNSRIYNISINDRITKSTLNKQTGQIIIEKELRTFPAIQCNINYLNQNKEYHNLFTNLPITNFSCIDFKQQSLMLEGNEESQILHDVYIDFAYCKNSSANNNECATQQEIDSSIIGGYFSIYYVDVTVNPKQIDDPFEIHLQKQNGQISSALSKRVAIKLKPVSIISDSGYVFESLDEKKRIQFENVQEFQDAYKKSEYFLRIELCLSQHKDVYQRIYKKVQNVLAEVGGLFQTLILIAAFISLPISELNFYISLLNEIFVFKEKEFKEIKTVRMEDMLYEMRSPLKSLPKIQQDSADKTFEKKYTFENSNFIKVQKKTDNNSSKNKVTVTSVVSNAFENMKKAKRLSGELDKLDLKDIHSKIIKSKLQQFFEMKRGGLTFKIFDYINYYFCPCGRMKRRKQQVVGAINQIHERLDTVFLLNKLVELDKLKMLLLSENQIKLFELIPQPVINPSKDTRSQEQFHQLWLQMNTNKTPVEKASEAFQSFKILTKQKQKSDLEIKLIQMIDPNLRQYFELIEKEERELNQIPICEEEEDEVQSPEKQQVHIKYIDTQTQKQDQASKSIEGKDLENQNQAPVNENNQQNSNIQYEKVNSSRINNEIHSNNLTSKELIKASSKHSETQKLEYSFNEFDEQVNRQDLRLENVKTIQQLDIKKHDNIFQSE